MMNGLNAYLLQHPLLVLLVIAHIATDFHFQSQKLADLKQHDLKFVLQHIAITAVPLIIIAVSIPNTWLICALILMGHLLIDSVKFFINKNGWMHNVSQIIVLAIDQMLHFIVLYFTYQLYHGEWHLQNPQWLVGILFILLITKPINIVFKLGFERYQSGEIDSQTIAGAGAMIGDLERILIGVLMIQGQFGSIGLVFTAKSIARYNKIAENPAFAEYYLIGSFFSLLSVLVGYWLILT